MTRSTLRWLTLPLWAALTTPAARAQDVEITIEDEPPPVEPSAAPGSEAAPASEDDLRAQIAALAARLAALETAPPPPVDASPSPPEDPRPDVGSADAEDEEAPRGLERFVERGRDGARWWTALGVRVSGYVQAQYENHQLSANEVDPDGDSLNLNRFVIRRARLRADRTWHFGRATVELDANTVRGPFVSVRRAEASVFYPNPTDPETPYVQLTAGLTPIVFGQELAQPMEERVFMERTAASLAFFRGEPDVGARVSGGVGPLRYALAVMNGVPVDDRPGAIGSPQQGQPTFIGRLGVDLTPAPIVQVRGGVSYLAGRGFHAGQPASKAGLLWVDANQDGFVTLNELTAQPAQAATPSATFPQCGVNADLSLGVRSPIGWTRLAGEFTLANNLDRSWLIADPVALGYDVREIAWYASILQELTPYAVIAFRVDHYEPDADLSEGRRGVFVPATASLTTLSPTVGAQLPGVGRLVFQYDRILDQLGRDERGEAIGLANDVWTLRLQMEF